MLSNQIKSYLPELDSNQFLLVVNIWLENGFSLNEQNTIVKIMDRSYYFYDMKQINLDVFLKILNGLITPQLKMDIDYIRMINGVLEKLNLQQISSSNLVYTIGVFSKLKVFQFLDNQRFELKLIEAFKARYEQIESTQLGLVAMSLAILQVNDNNIWEILEDRALWLIDEISFQEMVSTATALGMHNKGTEYFWKQFCDMVVNKLSQLKPDEITQTLLVLAQAQKQYEDVYQMIEASFLERYSEFDVYNSVLMFSCFGRLKKGTEIWPLFETDLKQFMEESNQNELIIMIPSVMNMSIFFYPETKAILKDYVIQNGQIFDDDTKDLLLDQFKNEGMIDDDLEQALEKNRLWSN